MNAVKKLSFLILCFMFLCQGAIFPASEHLAPNTILNKQDSRHYIQTIDTLRDALFKEKEATIEKILKNLPAGWSAFRFKEESSIERFDVEFRDTDTILQLLTAQKTNFRGLHNKQFFRAYIAWLKKVFPGLFNRGKYTEASIRKMTAGEISEANEIYDYQEEDFLVMMPGYLIENAQQHGKGGCIILLGEEEGESFFTVITKSEFGDLNGAMLAKEEKGAYRAEGSTDLGIALSDLIPERIQIANKMCRTIFHPESGSFLDVVTVSGSGQHSYTGADNYLYSSPRNTSLRGTAATCVLLKPTTQPEDGLLTAYRQLVMEYSA